VTTDETVIDEIEELDIHEDLKEELKIILEMEEVKKAITKMKREKAPGATGLSSDISGALGLDNPEIMEMRR
jgi:hypothetical protein